MSVDQKRSNYVRSYTDLSGKRRMTDGWENVHVCVEDYSGLAYAEVFPDEKASTAIGFMQRAIAFDRR